MTHWYHPLGRRLLALRYRLFQRHRHDRLVLERVAGRPLIVLPGVFNPVLFRTGALLAGCLDERAIPPGAAVLDLGTGSGVGAVFAAQWAAHVVAVDVNPAAVRCAQINVLLHGCADRVEVREGDLFAPVSAERFDVVLFNPPYYCGEPGDMLERAFRATGVIERFAAELGAVLKPGGRAWMVVSSDMDVAGLLARMRAQGYAEAIVRRREFINETVTLYEFAQRTSDARR